MKAAVVLLFVALVATAQAKNNAAAETSQEVMLGVHFLSSIWGIPQCIALTLVQAVLGFIQDVLVGCISSAGLTGAFSCISDNSQGLASDVFHSLATCGTH